MHIPAWIITIPFLTEVEIVEYNLQEKLMNSQLILKLTLFFISLKVSFFWKNVNTVRKMAAKEAEVQYKYYSKISL